jgi:hypothetical protein
MFSIFKRKTEKEKLEAKYEMCLKEAHSLSKTNRTASDAKVAEANKILEKIEKLN